MIISLFPPRKPVHRWLTHLALALALLGSRYALAAPQHGLSLYGDLKYPANFQHYDYTNPAAPKGGQIKEWALGTFDTFNSFIIKGTPAEGLGLIYDSLMDQAQDEPFSQYGLLAESVELAAQRDQVTFTLRPNARFADGHPVTAADVVFTFNALLEQGRPFYRAYLGDIARIEALAPNQVRFYLKHGDNRELPLIIGQIPILPAHFWQQQDFSATLMQPPLGSGPYRLTAFEPGRSVTYQRNPDYWGKDLPVNRGRYNFDQIRYDYYRDDSVALEAFKAGEYDFRQETSSKQWATSYTGPAFAQGRLIKQELPHQRPTGMQAFVFNTRKTQFSDVRVREALAYAFDFEWTNKNLFYGAYQRTESFFSNSPMAASALPDAAELALLEPLRDQVPAAVFSQVYHPPRYDGSGNIRRQLRQALHLLKDAGWQMQAGQLINTTTGQPFTFEILLAQKNMERVVAPVIQNLKRMGINATIRLVDVSQYINRLRQFDFDMIVGSFAQSPSPGNEQREFWGSYNADQPGSRNLIGIKNPAVDQLIEAIIQAPTREQLIVRCRALDRVLLWNHYVIPQFHNRSDRIAYRNIFAFPDKRPLYGLGFDTWWLQEAAR